MKPLPTALPLEEEIEVWRALAHRERFRVFGPYGILGKIRESDRRDAELMMYRAQLPGNSNATDLWLPSTLWAEVRGGRLSIGKEWP